MGRCENLAIGSREHLPGHPTLGNSFESFVIEQLLSAIPSDTNSVSNPSKFGASDKPGTIHFVELIRKFGPKNHTITLLTAPTRPSTSAGSNQKSNLLAGNLNKVVIGCNSGYAEPYKRLS